MTGMLLERGLRVVAFEIDRGLCRWLTSEAFPDAAGLVLVEGDFRATWQAALERLGPPSRIIGNLPYRSASLMIADLAEGGVRPDRCVLTVQRELADRMTAPVGSSDYAAFSVLCRCCFAVADRGDLQPGSFWPVPEVVSTVVELRPRKDSLSGAELALLSSVTRTLFASRRKTVRNNVGAWPGGGKRLLAALAAEGVDPGSRAEDLPPEAYVGVVRRLGAG
jgi:16S rRNA (adenine1518-N6/adenine1519-N6)-dimethyltransferase